MIQVTLGGVKAQEQTEKPFPKYMISKESGRIVYFEQPMVGVQINEVEYDKTSPEGRVSHFREDWFMDHFVDYDPSTAVNQPSKKEIPFPKLMITKSGQFNTIVAFEGPGVGVQLFSNSLTNQHLQLIKNNTWSMAYFEDLAEPITLIFENK